MWNGSSQVATWQATIASETTVRAARRISDRLDRSGLATLARYGREHFSEIGRLGDLSTVSRHRGQLSAWGKRGGRPRKASLADMREARSASWIAIGFAMSCASIRYHSGLHQDGKPIGPHWLAASWWVARGEEGRGNPSPDPHSLYAFVATSAASIAPGPSV